uniref:Uncharacterized protein n=1 Tax=Cacopsylla melanoneura TaxID=428564 RepID=A0A8D8TFK2_9HEMI
MVHPFCCLQLKAEGSASPAPSDLSEPSATSNSEYSYPWVYPTASTVTPGVYPGLLCRVVLDHMDPSADQDDHLQAPPVRRPRTSSPATDLSNLIATIDAVATDKRIVPRFRPSDDRTVLKHSRCRRSRQRQRLEQFARSRDDVGRRV